MTDLTSVNVPDSRWRGLLPPWHAACKLPNHPTSVNDDRQANTGLGHKRQDRIRTGKDAWNRKVSGVFFCFFKTVMSFVGS